MDQLTNEDLQNMIAFGNRAQMQGKEADTWFFLKQKLGTELTTRLQAAEAANGAEKTPGLELVGEDGA